MVFTLLGTLTGLAAVLNAVRFIRFRARWHRSRDEGDCVVVVGGASVTRRTGSVIGTVLGVILLAAIGPGLTFGVSAYWSARSRRDHPGRIAADGLVIRIPARRRCGRRLATPVNRIR